MTNYLKLIGTVQLPLCLRLDINGFHRAINNGRTSAIFRPLWPNVHVRPFSPNVRANENTLHVESRVDL